MSGIISGKDQDIVKISKELAKMSGLISQKDQEIVKMSEELTKISGLFLWEGLRGCQGE